MKSNNSLGEIRKLFINFFTRNGHIAYPSSSLLPKNDPSLMFVNAGMVQFKQRFLSHTEDKENIVSSQKCLRVGGKHNDLENVGHTNRHHTFFEMLGNFSFGNYFKEHAIELAWKFITQELQLNSKKLYITVYHEDNDSYSIWKKITGFSEEKIIRIKTDDNFWSMGNTGPCGPCSEIFYDYGEHIPGGVPGTVNANDSRFTEIWNLVFMQYHRTDDGQLHTLNKPCIDTGMGLERISAVMQGVYDNYDIDLFKSLIQESENKSNNTKNILAHRIIADHTRSSAFLIAEGITPGNEGRNYVLRRIIRRAARYVYQLGYDKPLLHEIFLKLLDKESPAYMADCYPELIRAKDLISRILVLEEKNFKTTLLNGLSIINKEISLLLPGDELSGDLAFKLYDTYGFPLDITLDIAREKKLKFDKETFDKKMNEQKQLSRKNWIGSGEKSIEQLYLSIFNKYGKTKFIGYNDYQSESKILSIISKNKTPITSATISDEEIEIIINTTPFYAESGGQQGDIGTLQLIQKTNFENTIIKVIDTKKSNNIHIHKCFVKSGKITIGDTVIAKIDIGYRKCLQANHSATHLLHHVLRKIIGSHVIQKGSLITADKLRFDFTANNQLTSKQIELIESEVNFLIRKNYLVSHSIDNLKNALDQGVIALFGEKYDDQVRIVGINESKELCGGTHVNYSGEIGLFKIISESSIAFGIRRIEAATGEKALNHIQNNDKKLQEFSKYLKVKQNDIMERLETLTKENRSLRSQIENLYQDIVTLQKSNLIVINGINFQYQTFNNIPVTTIRTAVIERSKNYQSIIVFSTTVNNKATLVIGVSKDITDKITAAELLSHIEEIINGKGGGKSEIAQISGNTKYFEKAISEISRTIAEKFK